MKTDSLWYYVIYRTKGGHKVTKRFLTFDEAINYKNKKFPFAKEIKSTDSHINFSNEVDFGYKIQIGCSRNAAEYAAYLKRYSNKRRPKKLIEFLSEKVIGIGKDVGWNIIFDILSQAEPMERENRILQYKIDNIEKFPEIKDVLYPKSQV